MERATGLAIGLVALVGLAGLTPPAAAQSGDAAELRRELEDMRRQFDAVKEQYQRSLESLTERIKKLEAQPTAPPAIAPSAPSPATAGTGPAAQGASGATPPGPSLLDLARPRQPFALQERSGRGALLFDIGVAADLVAAFSGKKVDDADVGTFAGRENRFFPREIELSLFGAIDPYARGEVRIEAAEEFEDGRRELHVGLAEAHLTLTSLPWGFQAKMGLMRERFGLLNERHAHDLPQIDRPNVLVNFFGEEGLVESGAEVSWVAPLPFYLELVGGAFDGDNDVAFGRASLRSPLVTGRLRTFFELDKLGAVQLGTSVATGETAERLRNTFWSVDGKYKLWPEAWRHPLLTVGGELMVAWNETQSTTETEVAVDTDGDGIPDAAQTVEGTRKRTRHPLGAYVWADVQPWKQWTFGLRYDYSQYLNTAGREWAIGPYVTFMPSEFLRFRLGYKYTDRARCDGFRTPSGGCARIANELFLQTTFVLGAHPAHPF